MSHRHLPSILRFPRADKAVQLKFNNDAFDLTLMAGRSAVCPSVSLTAGQIKQVTIEMMPVERGPLKLCYEDRHVVIRTGGKLWVKVPDVVFMQLHCLAANGQGEGIDL